MQQIVDTRGLINIYYGTTSGNSSRLAFQFADEAIQHNFIPKVFNLREFNGELFTQQQLCIFFVATYGVGGPTSDAIDFNNWLQSKDRTPGELKSMKFVVFALGNTAHEHFCGMGLRTDSKLEELGAQRVFQLGKGNSYNETTDKDYSEWIQSGLFKALESVTVLQSVPRDQIESSFYKVIICKEQQNNNQINLSYLAQKYQDSDSFKIIEKKELKKFPSIGNSTLYLSLETNKPYKSAQNIGIYPQNSQENIDNLCQFLNLDKTQIFKIETNGKAPFPNPISIEEYLTKYCDFLGPISKKALFELSQLVDCPNIQKELKYAASHEGREKYEEEYQKQRQCLFTIIKSYNIRTLKLQQLIELCPIIQPRYFTIASSSIKYPNNIEIIASELMINKDRLGLCSQYFKNVIIGQQLKGFIQDSAFIYPKNPLSPIMLIGPGAGLAPMRAFIQDKDQYIKLNKLEDCPFKGEMTLLFGCRTQEDFLFKEELESYQKNGTLNDIKIAYSREGQKIHVTHFLDVNYINNHLEKGGIIYICGSCQMGKDIQIQIENMFKQVRKVMPYLAYKKVNELEEQKIIIKELWG